MSSRAVTEDPRLQTEVAAHPHPLLFATVSGAHLYGFPSADSDFDLRGCHILSLPAWLGLAKPIETVTLERVRDGAEVDLVTHDVRKFLRLLLRNNGYVLEQLYSPLVMLSTPEHEELKEIARGCFTRACLRHYKGFAFNQWQLFEKSRPRRVKPLLYVYRVLLTGIHLMRSGELEADLTVLAPEMGLGWLQELVARKVEGPEKGGLGEADVGWHEREVERLQQELLAAAEGSHLPAEPTCREELEEFLIRLRMAAG